MSAATRHPARSAAVVVGGLALLTAPVLLVPLVVAGGWGTTVAGSALAWGVVWRLAHERGYQP